MMSLRNIVVKRCPILSLEGHEQYMKSIFTVSDIYYAGIMVPFSCQVCGNLYNHTHMINN